MPSTAVSESWQAASRALEVADFFAALPRQPFAFLYGEGRWLLLAEDPLVVFDAPEELSLEFQRRGELPPILPDLVGQLTYEYGYGLDPAFPRPPAYADALPDFQLTLYRRVQLYDRRTGRLYTGEREATRRRELTVHRLGRGPFAARKRRDTDDLAGYCAKVDRIREEIARGNVYQVDLTRQEDWAVQGDLTELAQRLHREDPAPCSALVADASWTILSSSPESFFRLDQGLIATRPIKGTAPRSLDPDDDRRLAAKLLACPKNRSELAMIVDLLRNDLGRICRPASVRVDAFPRLESFANVHHLVAEISGELIPGLSLAELLRAVFPGGSITGCPKLAAMSLIRELEPRPRRIYTGALGWCRADLQQGEFAIPIRTAWVTGDELHFGVGGGVVWDSDPRAEYAETLHKGRSLVRCSS